MQVEQIVIPQEEAKKQVQLLREVFKRNHQLKGEPALKDMQRVYGHMQKHSGAVIDLWEAFKKIKLDEKGNPKIAICRADYKQCQIFKRRNGSALFIGGVHGWEPRNAPRQIYGDIEIPQNTFNWTRPNMNEFIAYNNEIIEKTAKTIVPLIPPSILIDEVKHALKNYFILWEVEKWEPIPPRDPMLLKRLTPNLFAVLATWDLTELERALIRGRL